MSKNINILFTTSTLPRWKKDSELAIVFSLAKEIAKNSNYQIIILAPHYPGAKQFEKINNLYLYRFKYFFECCETLCYEGGISANIKNNKLLLLLLPFFFLSQLYTITKLVKKYNIHIIHAHWLLPQGLIAVLYKKFLNNKIKILATAHGSDIALLKKIGLKKLNTFINKNCNAISAVSEDLKNKMTSISFDNISLTPNGLNLSLFKKIKNSSLHQKYKNDNYCLLFVGRLTPDKGLDILLKSLPDVKKRYSHIKLLIIGSGQQKKIYQKLSHQLQLNDNTIFLGKIAQQKLPDYYSLANILIAPSKREGFGLAVVEAMACATPVIANNVGGLKKIITNNYDACLLNNMNPQNLAKKIIALLNDSKMRQKIAKNAPLSIKNNYKLIDSIKKYQQLYQKL